jgi:hypothetical protein
MKSDPSPVFVWVNGLAVNMALCQGMYTYEDDEDGWNLYFDMKNGELFRSYETEEEADAALASVYGVMQAHGFAIPGPAPE